MPFEPGKSGNPEGGRAHKRQRPVTEMFTRVLVQNPEKLRRACERVLDMAVEGDIMALKEIADRVEGKALQSVDVTDNRSTDSGRRLESLLFAATAGNSEKTDPGRTQ